MILVLGVSHMPNMYGLSGQKREALIYVKVVMLLKKCTEASMMLKVVRCAFTS